METAQVNSDDRFKPSVAEELRGLGYPNLTAAKNHISGVIYGIDMSDATRSVPENGGPFKTLDNADELIPDDIIDVCEREGLEATVLGSGPSRLHIHINDN